MRSLELVGSLPAQRLLVGCQANDVAGSTRLMGGGRWPALSLVVLLLLRLPPPRSRIARALLRPLVLVQVVLGLM